MPADFSRPAKTRNLIAVGISDEFGWIADLVAGGSADPVEIG